MDRVAREASSLGGCILPGGPDLVGQARALLEALARAGMEPTGSPEWARYNPPFWPWFMRRNEIQVEVRELGGSSTTLVDNFVFATTAATYQISSDGM